MSETVQPSEARSIDWKNILLTPWTVVILSPLLVFLFDKQNLQEILTISITAFAGTLPYIAFAVILIAWLKAAGAEAVIGEAFKGKENRMIVLAALFGGLAPFCSCEVIPFIAGLLAVGAPLSAVMAFWLSSPLIDPPTLLITAGALGWEFAIGKAVAAVAIGLLGGFSVKLLRAKGAFADPLRPQKSGGCGCSPSPFKGKAHWAIWQEKERISVFQSEFVSNALFLLKWLALAYTLEALLIKYIPASVIAGAVGGEGILPITLAAFIGMPAYLNGYVAPPLLAGLMEQGMGAGAAMSFMIAGSVSSIPAMTAVWSLVKKGVFLTYLTLGIFSAILSGVIFQFFA